MKGNLISWTIIIISLLSGAVIPFMEDFNLLYLMANLLVLGVTAFYLNSFQPVHFGFSRLLLGLLFIFSGFVKGVDPIGTQYQIEDYFIAYGIDWAIPFSMVLSVLLNSLEFIMGILLLFGVRLSQLAWYLLFLMIIFTLTTLNDALFNPVPDCGCFGDALKISNWQTLYKNLIINVFVLIVFAGRLKIKSVVSPSAGFIILLVTIAVFFGFEIYNIRHLPVIDFREWRVGRKMSISNPQPKKYFVTYRNKSTGDEKEYQMPDYPFNDSVWMSQWEFAGTRVVDPNPRMHNLSISDANNNEITSSIIENPEFQIIFVAFDLRKMNKSKLDQIDNIIRKSENIGISAVFLTSSLHEDTEAFIRENMLDVEYYFADDTELQAMIRSNPGLVLMKNGVVLQKWHHNDFPDFDELRNKYFNQEF